MFNLKNYDIPINLLVYVICKHLSYFELDHILHCFKLTSREQAQIKYKIYTQRLKIVKKRCSTEYRVENKLHREDGPAIVDRYGTIWYLNGKPHRSDGPAIECITGHKEWYINGKFIRGV